MSRPGEGWKLIPQAVLRGGLFLFCVNGLEPFLAGRYGWWWSMPAAAALIGAGNLVLTAWLGPIVPDLGEGPDA